MSQSLESLIGNDPVEALRLIRDENDALKKAQHRLNADSKKAQAEHQAQLRQLSEARQQMAAEIAAREADSLRDMKRAQQRLAQVEEREAALTQGREQLARDTATLRHDRQQADARAKELTALSAQLHRQQHDLAVQIPAERSVLANLRAKLEEDRSTFNKQQMAETSLLDQRDRTLNTRVKEVDRLEKHAQNLLAESKLCETRTQAAIQQLSQQETAQRQGMEERLGQLSRDEEAYRVKATALQALSAKLDATAMRLQQQKHAQDQREADWQAERAQQAKTHQRDEVYKDLGISHG